MNNFLARSKEAIEYFAFDRKSRKLNSILKIEEGQSKPIRTADSGRIFVTSSNENLMIWKVTENESDQLKTKIERSIQLNIPGCIDYVISPKANYLATYEKFSPNSEKEQQMNYSVWKLDFTSGTAEKLVSFSHKNQSTWAPQWTNDDSIMARMVTGEVHFYYTKDMKSVLPARRIVLEALDAFLLCPSMKLFKCAVFGRESKGRPGSVRIYDISGEGEKVSGNNLISQVLSQKTFFKADKCSMLWSPNGGRNLLVSVSTEVDRTGKSYYGESSLYFLAADGKFDSRIDLQGSAIHDFTWSPLGNEFIVIHGHMPAKTSLFDLKCNPVYEFACGSKNQALYNPAGNLITFGGFGNLPGTMEIWRRTGALSRIGAMQSIGTTVMEWSPDSSLLLASTLTPRLRVDNGFKIWSMTGDLLIHQEYNELYQVLWIPNDSSRFPAPKIEIQTGDGSSASVMNSSPSGELKKEAYRPPSLRNKPTSSISSPNNSHSAIVNQSKPPQQPVSIPSTISKEARAVRRIQEKLTSIAALKAKHAAGENLEPEQIEKMAREADIQKELEAALELLKLSQ